MRHTVVTAMVPWPHQDGGEVLIPRRWVEAAMPASWIDRHTVFVPVAVDHA